MRMLVELDGEDEEFFINSRLALEGAIEGSFDVDELDDFLVTYAAKPDLEAPTTQGPKREYLKEFPEDINADEIDISPNSMPAAAFNELFPKSDIGIKEFIMRTLGVNSLGGDGSTLKVNAIDGVLGVQGQWGKNIDTISRNFLPGGEEVEHNLLRLLPAAQGKGIAKKLMKEAMDLYVDMGIKKVSLEANIEGGAYAWARFGFVPTDAQWNDLRSRLGEKLQILYKESTIVTDDVVKRLSTLLSSPDPKALWKVADFMVGDKKIGKRLLLGDTWGGSLDLNDEEAMDRFYSYVFPEPADLESPTQGPKREYLKDIPEGCGIRSY